MISLANLFSLDNKLVRLKMMMYITEQNISKSTAKQIKFQRIFSTLPRNSILVGNHFSITGHPIRELISIVIYSYTYTYIHYLPLVY